MFLDASIFQEQFPEYMKNRALLEQLTSLADEQLKLYQKSQEVEVVYNPHLSGIDIGS